MSVTEFEAKARNVYSAGWKFFLYDRETGTLVADGNLEANEGGFVPASIDESGDQCFLTIRMEYDHEFNKQENDLTNEEIAARRDKYREQIENL